jgi:hypothetical protein
MSAPLDRDRRGRNIQTHGSGGYSRGCRCAVCKSGHAEYARHRRAAAASRRAAAPATSGTYIVEGIRHGSAHGYREKGCRCKPCYQAKKFGAKPVTPAVPACVRCKADAPDGACCSSHGKTLCHRCYRLTHFVERCRESCTRCAREGLEPMAWPGTKVGAS